MMDPKDVLIKILNEKKLVGTDKKAFVAGNSKVICFQDLPLYSVSQNAYYEGVDLNAKPGYISYKENARYVPFGLLFTKKTLWDKGARPVIYEDKRSFLEKLDSSEHWRVVHMDLSNPADLKDFTHEREWRLKTDEFTFEYEDVYILLDESFSYRYFVKHASEEIQNKIRGIIMLHPVIF
ncbi:DUF2971 domain-containing protein [Paenibacillus azoreducens]|uniref:Uncharacterized protein n=1 Tax=Paenibacillus azoreducens TaxID=116718 RepID=A0A919YDH5_9BACL|nr:DUF2971 domain-containing protein [Paenibacillus azoreducens]GIO47075.1 hypothetical protein J34TS1_18400 [Paenibacillus azoreducens]